MKASAPKGGWVTRWHWIAFIFVGLALLAFGPALAAPFDFDDLPAITHNATIRTLWPPSVPLSPPGLGSPVSGRPISNYSFALSYAFNRWFGVAQSPEVSAPRQTIGYHAATILLHIVVALLLFGLVRRTIRLGRIPDDWRDSGDRFAAIVAGIWLVHPIQTEAVDYISQRTEILVSLWYVLTVYAALRSWSDSRRNGSEHSSRGEAGWIGVSVASCLLGMGTKEVMLTAPLVVVLFDRAFLYERWIEPWTNPIRRTLYLALFATSAWSIFLIASGGRTATAGFHLRVSWSQYLYSQAWAIPHYLLLVAWPFGLSYDYGQNPIAGRGAIAGLIVLLAAAVGTVLAWRRPKWQWLGFVGAWFFLLLGPSSSFVPIQTEIAAERRIYLALAAVIVVAVAGAEALYRNVRRGNSKRRGPGRGLVAAGTIIAALTAISFARSRMYVDPELLWRDAVGKHPDNARALDGLAVAELRSRPRQLAEPDSLLTRALALDSTYVLAYISRAAIAISRSRFANAESLLVRALRIAPDDSAATEKMGRALLADDHSDEAIPYLLKMVRWNVNGETLTNLGVAYLSSGQLDSATVTLRRALAMDPSNVEAMRDLGGALIEQERGQDAVPVLTQAVRTDPASGFAFAMLSLALAQSRQPELASQATAAAISRAPNDPVVYQFAGRAAQTAGRVDDAIRYLSQAMRLDPNDPQTITRLGSAEASMGRKGDAKRLFERALTIAPGYPRAQQALRELKMQRQH